MGFSKFENFQFFALLIKVIDENKLTAVRIPNTDGCGVTVVLKQHSRIIPVKGQSQFGVMISPEHETSDKRSLLFSGREFYTFNIVFSQQKVEKGTLISFTCKGVGLNAEDYRRRFLRWFQKFIEFSNASRKKRKTILFSCFWMNIPPIPKI